MSKAKKASTQGGPQRRTKRAVKKKAPKKVAKGVTAGTSKSYANRRTPAQREVDLATEWEMYCRGHSQRAIAKVIGVTQQAICLDLAVTREQYLERKDRAIELWLAEELGKIDLLEKTYWEAWEQSKLGKVIKTTSAEDSAGGSKQKIQERNEAQVGNPQFLAGVATCIDKRMDLLGIQKPKQMEVADTTHDDPDRSRSHTDATLKIFERISKTLAEFESQGDSDA